MERNSMHLTNHALKGKYVAWSFLAILAGGFIYVLFRPGEPIFFHWLGSIGFENWLGTVREKSLSITRSLPPWMVYSLPNGLWAFAYTLLILTIWKGSHSRLKYGWFLSIPLLVFGFELLQFTGHLPGTFCKIDLLWGATGIILGVLTVNRTIYQLKPMR